ncbi:MAG: site-specific integrase [Paracoccaceae bacterium]|uniref:tyrosine-type recombinase/integrase n=1 Tax=Rhodobacterales TaxID=204455 RepID=UPI0032997361
MCKLASIKKTKVGTYRAFVARQGKRKSKIFPTKREATDWANRQEFLILNDEVVQAGVPFGDMLDRYAREVSSAKRGARWEIIRIAKLRKHPIAEIRMGKLTQRDFAEWRDERLKEVAPASVNREMVLMSGALTHARKEWNMIKVNPMTDVAKPKKSPPRKRRPSSDEIERMQFVAGSDLTKITARVFHCFLFAIETAMRAGEIARLTRDDIDVEKRVAHLSHTKNGEERDVSLSRRAVELIEALPELDPLFGLSVRQMDALFRKIKGKANVEGLTFHDSRHEAITRLSTKLDVLALARMVGHKNINMLMVYYDETAEELAKRLD